VGCKGGKKIDSDQALDQVVGAMCQKMVTCQPNAMPSEQFCKDTMKTALASSQQKPEVAATQKDVDKCITNIQKAECQTLLGDKAPEGCNFLE
jgi:hypothetical protein